MADDNSNGPVTPIAPQPKKPRFTPPTPSPELIAKLEDEHEDVIVIRGTERAPWAVILRRPTRQESILYKQHGKKDGPQSVTANDAFVRKIAVWPEMSTLEAIIAKWPFMPDAVTSNSGFKEFVGAEGSEDLKG